MKKIKIGVICPSEIAFRRFMPALSKLKEQFEFVGIAVADETEWNGKMTEEMKANEYGKADAFIKQYGGKIFNSYKELIEDSNIHAVYIPLPPALHHKWAKYALEHEKHVFVEKPSTTCVADTQELIELATEKQLALHENYMFVFHRQIEAIQKIVDSKEIGDVRLIRANFGFPKRSAQDFRYNKSLGGGALLDCGGYPLKLATLLLGDDIRVDASKLIYNEQDIDLYGSVQLSSQEQAAQISFGMDNEYRCDIEIWGSQGFLRTGRIFSAPDQLACRLEIEHNHEIRTVDIQPDDTFKKSLEYFYSCIMEESVRKKTYRDLLKQITLVEDTLKMGA